MTESASFSLSRVRLRHYRSIRVCDVKLGDLNLLVCPNGSSKSNVLDALRLVSQASNENLDNALRERGGVGEVRRRSTGHPPGEAHYFVRSGELISSSVSSMPRVADDRLYPVAASGLEDSRTVSDGLAGNNVFAINPDAVRQSEKRDAGDLLRRDGSNTARQLPAVRADDGVTRIARIDQVGGKALRDSLFTAGELVRVDQLQPSSADQIELFT